MTTFDSTQWAKLVETAYDRAVDFELRSIPTFRQLIDKRPVRQAMPGDVVTFTLHNDLAAITSALNETSDGNEVTVSTPTRVSVTLSERGSYSNMSGFLKATAFTEPVMERAELMARQQADSIDLLVKATMDSTTNKYTAIGSTGGLASTGTAAITPLKLAHIHQGTVALRRENVVPASGNDYLAYVHPNHGFDLRVEAGPNAWVNPHTEGGDTAEYYSGQVGRLMGTVVVETPRCTTESLTPASTPYVTYPVYMLGKQALVEAAAIEPHATVGTVVDHFNRFFPLGWYGLLGHALYRAESLLKINAMSTISI